MSNGSDGHHNITHQDVLLLQYILSKLNKKHSGVVF